jgi:hypothetical protein
VLESALKGHDLARITILNVDDTNEPRYAVTRLLRKTGFTVIEAKNGREALAKASSFRPSLIILDVNLPIIHLSATYPADAGQPGSYESGGDRFLEHPSDLLELSKPCGRSGGAPAKFDRRSAVCVLAKDGSVVDTPPLAVKTLCMQHQAGKLRFTKALSSCCPILAQRSATHRASTASGESWISSKG